MIEKNQLVKKKIKIQQVKNKLKLLNGIEILETFENDEIGCDSRDEYNYLIDIWACAK